MGRRVRSRAQTKQDLMDAFWEVYCETRIERVTVKEITTRAGYSRGTFYEYYTDVYDVLEQIEESLIPSLEELPPLSVPTGSLGMPLDMFLETFRQNAKYYSVLLGDQGDPAFAGKLKKSIKPTIMRIFEDKPNVDREALEYILEYTISAMIGIMGFWFQQEEALSRDKLLELIHRLMQDGVTKHLPC